MSWSNKDLRINNEIKEAKSENNRKIFQQRRTRTGWDWKLHPDEMTENGKEVLYLRAKLVKNNVFGQE